MRWDMRLEGDVTRIGHGATIAVNGVELRRVVAFDTREGWALARSIDGECGCGFPPGVVHLRTRAEPQGLLGNGYPPQPVGQPCLTVHVGRVDFIPGEDARPDAPVLFRKRVSA